MGDIIEMIGEEEIIEIEKEETTEIVETEIPTTEGVMKEMEVEGKEHKHIKNSFFCIDVYLPKFNICNSGSVVHDMVYLLLLFHVF